MASRTSPDPTTANLPLVRRPRPHLSGAEVACSHHPDLELVSCIKSSKRRAVYRAMSKQYGTCVVKTTTLESTNVALSFSSSAREVEMLRHEFHKLQMCASSPHIVSAFDFRVYTEEPSSQASLSSPLPQLRGSTTATGGTATAGCCVALVTKDCGPSLQSWAESLASPPALEQVLEIGIQIAMGLDYLHRWARLIHSDINPSNVCYVAATKKAVIVNLGAAHGFLEPFKAFTPAFQSPEQAYNGLIDHRSDLYALGVLLFQLYTKRMPIEVDLDENDSNKASATAAVSADSYRMAHMLQPPLAVSAVRPDCHPMFDQIIARLLVKEPNRRYATAAGLQHDLQHLLSILSNDSKISKTSTGSFELGTQEVPFQLLLPNQLIARQDELAMLQRLYNRSAAAGTGNEGNCCCCLEGAPGVGKTALVQAFAARERNRFFLSYKFDQFGNTPMGAIIQIMSRLVHQTISHPDYSDDNLRAEFFDRLSRCDVLRGLVDLIPAYAKLISAPTLPAIPEGLGGDVRRILYPAIKHVLAETRKFCQVPIVLFFDDVQWIDPGTKRLLSYLLAERVPIFMILAFRDRTSQNTFTLESLFNNTQDVGEMKEAAPRTIQPVCLSLAALSKEATRELIGHLELSEADKIALADEMYKLTEGNPLFLRFRLNMMAETNALVYDVNSRRWRFYKDRVAVSTAVVAENVVEFCTAALRTLDREVSSVLCRLAMMPQGRSLTEYTCTLENEKGVVALASAKSCSVAQLVHNAVAVAVQKSLLYHTGNGVRFAHDRLQQGAAQCVSAEEAAEIHFYLGQHDLPAEKSNSEQTFQVLDHFRRSQELVTDPDLIFRIGTLTTEICSFYATAGSHEQLDGMLQFSRNLLQKLDNRRRNSEPFSSLEVCLLLAHHRIKFLMNDLDIAESLFDMVRPRLRSPAEICDAYDIRISLLINSASHHKAIEATAEVLALLGDHSLPQGLVLPDGQPAGLVTEVTQQIKDIFGKHPHWDVENFADSLVVSSDDDHKFRVEMMIKVIPSMYLIGRFDLYMYVPAIVCRSILENGVTTSSGNAFSVLGFALVAIFGDNFGAEVAMIGKHLVDRFDNDITVCRAYCLSAIAVVYDQRYDNLASRLMHASYVAGRSAHDLLWANYSIYLLGGMLVFEGVALPDILDKMQDLYVYAVNSGHQDLAKRATKAVLHTASMLIRGRSAEGPVFHFSIPTDEITNSQPLIGFSHGALSLVTLFFTEQLRIAWRIIKDILASGLDKSAPGLPVMYIFHFYTVVVAHGLLVRTISSDDNREGGNYRPMSENEREELKDVMKSSSKILDNLNGMAPIFSPYAHAARACIVNAIEGKPLEALPMFESVVSYIHEKKPEKHHDVVAASQMISASICHRAGLMSIQAVYISQAIRTLGIWGAQSVVEHVTKEATTNGHGSSEPLSQSSSSALSVSADGVNLASANRIAGRPASVRSSTNHFTVTASAPKTPKYAPDFASLLATASYITSFNSFDELTEKLSSTLLKQATATRLLLLMRNPESGALEPTTQSTLSGLSPPDTLRNVKYSIPIVKVTDKLQEAVVVHSAQQESPYCFEPYIQESGVISLASIPITYQNSLVAVIYIEHEYREGVFTPEIMETMALLGQHVASAIVHTQLLRDARLRSVQLEQSHADLAKALRVKDTILSNTSHELRTPLNGIIGLNEHMLASDVELDPEVESCMKTTLAMAHQLLSLVSDILDISRIGEGALRLHYETTSLHSIVMDAVDISKFTARGIHLVNNVSESFPEIIVDPARLRQVIFNLMSNAIKFTSEGSVTISCDLLEDKKMFMLAVTDTGIGIDPAHLDVIFEPFGQVESHETRQHKGAGLGLPITKQLVMLHGGHIDVVSKVGEGTSFQVILPMTPADNKKEKHKTVDQPAMLQWRTPVRATSNHPEHMAEETKDREEVSNFIFEDKDACIDIARLEERTRLVASSPQNKSTIVAAEAVAEVDTKEGLEHSIDQESLRILIVDDTPLNVKILSSCLSKANMVVASATNGQELLQMLAGDLWTNYDVVLLDWMMPIMDGITACRLLRRRIKRELLPVMFLTAKSDPTDITKAFEAGATDFATKPFDRHEILARTTALGRAARRARARSHDSIPMASLLLPNDSFWKMRSATRTAPMFVITILSRTMSKHCSHEIDGPQLLVLFRSEKLTFDSEWQFCEVGEDSVTFAATRTTVQQITTSVRVMLAAWAEKQVLKSVAKYSVPGEEDLCYRPLISIGVDHRPVHVHLFAEQQPMMATVESCASVAKLLAAKGTQHEDISLSESATAALEA